MVETRLVTSAFNDENLRVGKNESIFVFVGRSLHKFWKNVGASSRLKIFPFDSFFHLYEHRNNPRRLCKTVDNLLQPPKQDLSTKLTANDFAIFFKDKVAKIRSSTATAQRPVISSRQTPSLSSFPPVTVEEINKLLNSSPSKSCQLMAIGSGRTLAVEHKRSLMPAIKASATILPIRLQALQRSTRVSSWPSRVS